MCPWGAWCAHPRSSLCKESGYLYCALMMMVHEISAAVKSGRTPRHVAATRTPVCYPTLRAPEIPLPWPDDTHSRCGRIAGSIGELAVLHVPSMRAQPRPLCVRSEPRSHHVGRVSPSHGVQASLTVMAKHVFTATTSLYWQGVLLCTRPRRANCRRVLPPPRARRSECRWPSTRVLRRLFLTSPLLCALRWMWLHCPGARQTQALTSGDTRRGDDARITDARSEWLAARARKQHQRRHMRA